MKNIFILFSSFLLLSCCHLFATDLQKNPNLSKILRPETITAREQALFFEKFGDLLNIIDDSKKREIFAKDFSKFFTEQIFSWEVYLSLFLYILKLSIVICVYFLIKRLGMKILNYQINILQNNLMVETITSLLRSIFIWLLRFIFTLLFLVVMGISVGPLIYGVSFLGFGITLASQNIIKDFINGILIIMDGSVAVGEIVQVANNKGKIENITLRSLAIRDHRGDLVTVPFSTISEVINFSRNFSKIRVEVIVQHDQNLEDVKKSFEEAFLKTKKTFAKNIKEELFFLGVVNINEFGSHVAAAFKSIPDPNKTIYNDFLSNTHESMIKNNVKRIDGKQF